MLEKKEDLLSIDVLLTAMLTKPVARHFNGGSHIVSVKSSVPFPAAMIVVKDMKCLLSKQGTIHPIVLMNVSPIFSSICLYLNLLTLTLFTLLFHNSCTFNF
jgi:hypothetical protein